MRLRMAVVLTGVIAMCLAAYVSVVAAREPAGKEAKPDLKVSIAIPLRGERRTWWWGSGHFDVVITNVSDKTIRLWDNQGPNGYGSLTFNMVGPDGKKSVVEKKTRQWERTPLPKYQALGLEPGDSMVIEVNPDEWDGFPTKPVPAGKEVELDLQAVFEIGAGQESEKLGVWTGKVESSGMRHFAFRS